MEEGPGVMVSRLLALHLCKGALRKVVIVQFCFHDIIDGSHLLRIRPKYR